jgi:hypothetical protein
LAETVTFDSPSVHSYLSILQTVIGRMATNSASCKTWCVTLVSAIAVVIADKNKPALVFIAAVPIFLFLFLDAYYLLMEREFRATYNDFLRKLHFGGATVEDVFFVAPRAGVARTSVALLRAMGSASVWPFYALLALMLVVLRSWVL